MSKEQAIEILEDVQKAFMENAFVFSDDELFELKEAFQMAISALAE